jgi:hypothetical protein
MSGDGMEVCEAEDFLDLDCKVDDGRNARTGFVGQVVAFLGMPSLLR